MKIYITHTFLIYENWDIHSSIEFFVYIYINIVKCISTCDRYNNCYNNSYLIFLLSFIFAYIILIYILPYYILFHYLCCWLLVFYKQNIQLTIWIYWIVWNREKVKKFINRWSSKSRIQLEYNNIEIL